MDELALPASLSPPNIPTTFDPIPTEFEQIPSSTFEQIPITFEQTPTSFEPLHSEKSDPEEIDNPPIVKTDNDDDNCDDENDDLICVTKQLTSLNNVIGEGKKERL